MKTDEIVSMRYIENDVNEAVKFYSDKLNFRVDMHPAPGFAALSLGNIRLLLNEPGVGGAGKKPGDGQSPEPGGWNRIQIAVDDIRSYQKELREKGVRFKSDIIEGQGGKQILIEDPSGNLIELFEAKQKNDVRHASPSANKENYARFYNEVLNNGNINAADEIIDRDVVSHSPLPGQEAGLEGFKKAISGFRNAFPDLRSAPQDILAEGDKVIGRFIVTGTHRGEFMNMVPTGKSFQYEEIVIVKFKNGKITEHWAVADTVSFLEQLGLIEFKNAAHA
jgi:steroid delta-isomerase-like uncharacterized protein